MFALLAMAGDLGGAMGTALITTLYGCIMAHMVFGPVAQLLRGRDEEDVLCKQIIVEGVMAIQAGENPRVIEEKLKSFLSPQERQSSREEGGGEADG